MGNLGLHNSQTKMFEFISQKFEQILDSTVGLQLWKLFYV